MGRFEKPSFPMYFFMGKGGVGKTTSAATFALSQAKAGKKVLIVSLDPAHNLGDVLGVKLGERHKEVTHNLWASEIDFDKMVKQYMRSLSDKIKDIYGYLRIFNLEGYVDTLRYSPGVEEHATLEKIKEIVLKNQRSWGYDVIIFDTPPTGLTVRIMALPTITSVWIDKLMDLRLAILGRRKTLERIRGEKPKVVIGGREYAVATEPDEDPIFRELKALKEEVEWIRNALRNPSITSVVMVINPEVLPVLEARRACDFLRKIGIPVKYVIVNKVMELKEIPEELRERIREQERAFKLIEESFRGLKMFKIPYLPWEPRGLERLEEVSKYLNELGG